MTYLITVDFEVEANSPEDAQETMNDVFAAAAQSLRNDFEDTDDNASLDYAKIVDSALIREDYDGAREPEEE